MTDPADDRRRPGPPVGLDRPSSVAAWYPDPTHRHQRRYWDGRTWTVYVVDGARLDIDPRRVTTASDTLGGVDSRPFSDDWMRRYCASVVRESGVADDDGQNLVQVYLFATTVLLDGTAEAAMLGAGDLAQHAKYQEAVASGVPPSQRVVLLVEWNASMYDVLLETFTQQRARLVDGGRITGRHRFFPSRCCHAPLEFPLASSRPICTACGETVEETNTR